jgi:D-hydroxyproline dehydrogenase subunit beta
MSSHKAADVAIVGAGILGLTHAYLAARAGKSVVVFERSPRAVGASVRNFGMIWPIGQPSGTMHEIALRSRALWIEMLTDANLPSRREGSLHVAYHRDEAEVIQEFVAHAPALGYDCTWLDRDAVLTRSPAIAPEGLLGALWSPTEFTVDPSQVLAALPVFLAERYGVRFEFQCPVHEITAPLVVTAHGTWRSDITIVCNGDDFETLYPAVFIASRVTRCKLQMMRTPPQPDGWQLGPSLAAGLTLRFYPAFEICNSVKALKQRIAAEMPEYDRWAIHALVSQTANGAITLGDSHEYALAPDIFNKEEIDRLILQYIAGFLRIPDPSIAQRWHGVYAKHPQKPFLAFEPEPGVRIVTATGGSGMTLSFGLAERTLSEIKKGIAPAE